MELRLVACRSRKLSSAEKNYPVHENEMLAFADTLEEWRHYLLGVAVLVYTDNSALSYLQKNPKPSPRQVRWLEKMQRYDLKILTDLEGVTWRLMRCRGTRYNRRITVGECAECD